MDFRNLARADQHKATITIHRAARTIKRVLEKYIELRAYGIVYSLANSMPVDGIVQQRLDHHFFNTLIGYTGIFRDITRWAATTIQAAFRGFIARVPQLTLGFFYTLDNIYAAASFIQSLARMQYVRRYLQPALCLARAYHSGLPPIYLVTLRSALSFTPFVFDRATSRSCSLTDVLTINNTPHSGVSRPAVLLRSPERP